ncbi:methyl-accepting chemotaxis protein, partial [Aliarcobacter butzleri]
ETLVNGLNTLQQTLTQMLVENKTNGLTLDKSSNVLLSNVDKLNLSSNEAAASLEETAAALEEVTSNVRNNTQNIAQMAKLS